MPPSSACKATSNPGAGLEKFREMVAAQGGNLDTKRTIAPASDVPSEKAGYVTAMNVEQLGMSIIELGGGRKKLGDKLDHSTGLEMLVRLGDKVDRGQPLVPHVRPARQSARRPRRWSWKRSPFPIPQQPVPKLIVERNPNRNLNPEP